MMRRCAATMSDDSSWGSSTRMRETPSTDDQAQVCAQCRRTPLDGTFPTRAHPISESRKHAQMRKRTAYIPARDQVRTRANTDRNASTYSHAHARTRAHTKTHTLTRTRTKTRALTLANQTHTHACTHAHKHTHARKQENTQTHVHTHTYVRVHTQKHI